MKYLNIFLIFVMGFMWSGTLWAADFSGNWQSQEVQVVFYDETGVGSQLNRCHFIISIEMSDSKLMYKNLNVDCTDEQGRIFQHDLPDQLLWISDEGKLYDETGSAGQIKDQELLIKYTDFYDGQSDILLTLTADGMLLNWDYWGAMSVGFKVNNGTVPLKKF